MSRLILTLNAMMRWRCEMRKVDHKSKAKRLKQYSKIQPMFESKPIVEQNPDGDIYMGMHLLAIKNCDLYWIATQYINDSPSPLKISKAAHNSVAKRSGLISGDLHIVPLMGFSTGNIEKLKSRIALVVSAAEKSKSACIVFVAPTISLVDKIHSIMGANKLR